MIFLEHRLCECDYLNLCNVTFLKNNHISRTCLCNQAVVLLIDILVGCVDRPNEAEEGVHLLRFVI